MRTTTTTILALLATLSGCIEPPPTVDPYHPDSGECFVQAIKVDGKHQLVPTCWDGSLGAVVIMTDADPPVIIRCESTGWACLYGCNPAAPDPCVRARNGDCWVACLP